MHDGKIGWRASGWLALAAMTILACAAGASPGASSSAGGKGGDSTAGATGSGGTETRGGGSGGATAGGAGSTAGEATGGGGGDTPATSGPADAGSDQAAPPASTTDAAVATDGASADRSAATGNLPPGGKVLIFTHSTGYRHVSIEAEAEAMRAALTARGYTVTVSADPALFTMAGLSGLRGIVLVSTTGKPLGDPGTDALAALDAYVKGGGALIGIHAASSTFYDPTAPYTQLIGGRFVNHPGAVRSDTCYPEGTNVAAVKLPMSFKTTDEIYVMDNLRPDNQILLRCDALTGNTRLPIAWVRDDGAGRVFYSALGHSADDFKTTSMLMQAHFLPGTLWALRDAGE